MNIGWIGTGVMGAAMAAHVQKAGHELFVYNRTKEKAEALVKGGAHWCESPAEVGKNADVVFSIVGFPTDVEGVYLGTSGVLSARGQCKIIVDMTTSTPTLAKKIARAAEEKGVKSLDAPVTGGDIGARKGTLAVMVGGDKEAYEKALPIMELFSSKVTYFGGPGAGQHAKACNQISVAGTMIGMVEAMLYAYKQGLDPEAVIDVVGSGAGGSWSMNNLAPRIVKGDYKSGFFVEHFVKDMGIALQEANAVGLSLPGLSLIHQLYVAVKAQGHGRSATQSLFIALKSLSEKEDTK
ncbi:MAG: NAD(P)-dependent oxidoreductase [Deltaproteobacteria bacterium]|nr:NAD(P)-dependent oxidoreductase [Deltaproteobacteria bacterium]MBW2082431.1 NAD(P)-dependent oxidoreductase [Deltaproteobacteria bacterium]HDM09030.1 NAD(P)-dependent oxidoreductase [Desulfobacteraceae bacterium]